MQRSEDIPQSLEPPGIAHSALGGNNSGPNLTRSTSTTLSPDIPDSPASEFSSASSVDTGSFSSTQSGMTNNELFAAANRDRDSIGRSAVLKGSQVDSSLSQGGVGYADGPNPATLPSELTDPALQTSVKPSEMSTVREHLDAPHSIHNTNPNGERTEAQMVIGKRAAAPSRNDDISHFISNVSEQAAFISGRFGDIFTAVHKEVGKIALKRLRVGDTDKEKGALRSFEREANTWRRLHHTHILEFLGTYKRGEHLYLVSPFVENGTLLKYIETHPGVNRVRLLCEIADAVSYLHGEGIVHGDIKARNILIGVGGHVLLCDFGLTKLACAQTSLPLKGVGTTRWQSPELLKGGSKTTQSDVYAFSMTIVEVLTGTPPFSILLDDPAVIVALLVENKRPEKNPMESNGVSCKTAWQVAEACWASAPDDRITMSKAFRLLKDDLLFQARQRRQLCLPIIFCSYYSLNLSR